MHTNKSQGMALSAGANITGLKHTLHATAGKTISTIQAGNPRESTQNRDFNCLHLLLVQHNMKMLIIGTEQHTKTKHNLYWCSRVRAPPTARTIN